MTDLDQLARELTGMADEDPAIGVPWDPGGGFSADKRAYGEDWPQRALTMIGLARLGNLRYCIETVLADGVPGDFIETGIWRGGACIFMRAVLAARGVTDRLVWCADSFAGLPPDPQRDDDRAIAASPEQQALAVPLEQVRAGFAAHGLLDYQVRFLPGWFADTLPGPVGALAVLRLDGDLYCSTTDVLTALYSHLEPGGFCIIDDWCIPNCRDAVTAYRAAHGISEPVREIDRCGVFWRREAG